MDGSLWHYTGGNDQDHPQKKKCKKAKWLSEEALQIAEQRRDAKDKGETERYNHLNAEFQKIARRDKEACSQFFYEDSRSLIPELCNNSLSKAIPLTHKCRLLGIKETNKTILYKVYHTKAKICLS